MNKIKKIGSMVAVCILLFTAVPVIPAQAAVQVPSSIVVMADGSGTQSIQIEGLSAKKKLQKPSSSNSAVASIRSYSNYQDVEKKVGSDGSNYSYYSGNILFTPKKAGTTTIRYKIGNKTYKTKVTVKKYSNPIKSIKMTNVNGGKDFSKQFKTSTFSDILKINKNGSCKLSVSLKSGWKITGVYFSNNSRYFRGNSYQMNKASVFNLNLGTLKKGALESVILELQKGKISTELNIHMQ